MKPLLPAFTEVLSILQIQKEKGTVLTPISQAVSLLEPSLTWHWPVPATALPDDALEYIKVQGLFPVDRLDEATCLGCRNGGKELNHVDVSHDALLCVWVIF